MKLRYTPASTAIVGVNDWNRPGVAIWNVVGPATK
jgi:hypothetical protein